MSPGTAFSAADAEDVRRIALGLPETSERPAWGNAAWRVRDKMFVWERPLRASDRRALGDAAPDGAILGARVEHLGAKEALIADDPSVYFTTPHFDGYAAVLVRMGNAAEALPYAEHAVRVAPDSADAFTVLGFARFGSDDSKGAVQAWKKSLSLRPDPALVQYIAKAQRELVVESDYAQSETGHFTIRYEGKHTPDALRREIVATLESHYNDLSGQLRVRRMIRTVQRQIDSAYEVSLQYLAQG